ncbi:hypothetical protein BDR26DRAFT_859328 [Obelidium mucronatum]|nr:hypothetical protein BDR26DRAFT_859328 [Obelidium mucronatum]
MALARDATHIAHAGRVISEAVSRFGISGLGMSFNGGKDCTVMLHILALVLNQHQQGESDSSKLTASSLPKSIYKMPSLYVTATDPFPEVDAFVDHMADLYNLEVYKTSASMKDGLEDFLGRYPNVKAVLVGTRRTDPYSNHLKEFDPTDNGWPDCVRVHPILDWSYTEIWDFLKDYKVEYCSLYDKGYTSLGGIHNTLPNPALKNKDGGYHPAYLLTDGQRERDGRLVKH